MKLIPVLIETNRKVSDVPFTVKLTKTNQNKLICGNPVGDSETTVEIYLVSPDAIISKDDWYLYFHWPYTPDVMQCRDNEEADRCNNHYDIKKISWKIIASTDISINVLRINEQSMLTLINYYNKHGELPYNIDQALNK